MLPTNKLKLFNKFFIFQANFTILYITISLDLNIKSNWTVFITHILA